MCRDTRFEVIHRALDNIIIQCLAQDSCASLFMSLNHSTVSSSVEVLCLEHHSCHDMKLDVDDSLVESATIVRCDDAFNDCLVL